MADPYISTSDPQKEFTIAAYSIEYLGGAGAISIYTFTDIIIAFEGNIALISLTAPSGKVYPIQKETLVIENGISILNTTLYRVAEDLSESDTSPWTLRYVGESAEPTTVPVRLPESSEESSDSGI